MSEVRFSDYEPLAGLRMIRDEKRDLERRIAELDESRDFLIFNALAEGHSMRKTGRAAGLTSGRISQVKSAGLDKFDVAVRAVDRQRESAISADEIRERAEAQISMRRER